VHGTGGTIGAILTGVFAVAAINMPPIFKVDGQPDVLGLIEGNNTLILNQLAATGITWVIAIVGAFILLKLTDVICGLRVTESDEYDGLDLTQHGESGYNMEEAFSTFVDGNGPTTVGSESPVARTAHA
jgi:Amt family ammonium transporter